MEKRSKFKSRRFIAAFWAMAMITVIILFDKEDFVSLTIVLAGVVGVWIGAETVSKKDHLPKEELK